MNRRKRKQLLVAVVLTAAAVMPGALLVGLSYGHSERTASQVLDQTGGLALDRAEQIVATADVTLNRMAGSIKPVCDSATLETLRQAVYDTLYFRESGLIVDGHLVCTSAGALDPPVTVNQPEHQAPDDDALHIAMPLPTLQGESSIIVLRRIGPGGAVNLLLNPLQFGESLQERFTRSQFSARLERAGGALLLTIGAPSSPPGSLSRTLVSTRYPLRVTISAPESVLQAHRQRQTLFAGLVGLAVSAALIWLLLKLLRRRLAQGEELREALAGHEFRVQYQPVMDVMTGECVGAEALIRWQHPDRGLLLPNDFLPLAEQAGLMLPVTTWMMRHIALDMAETLAQNPRFHISLNLSPGLLHDLALPAAMMRALGPSVPPWRIIFEITEEQLVQAGDGDVAAAVDALRETGALLALDDFGTGYANLKSLGDLPFDFLKIDKGLVDTVVTQPATSELVSAIVALALRLNLKVVAEGVETEAQLDRLRELGITLVQGWYFSKSLTTEDFTVFVAQNRGMPLDVAPH